MVRETIQWAVGKLKKGADVISGRGIWPLGLIWDKISAGTPAPFNYLFSGYRWIQLLSYPNMMQGMISRDKILCSGTANELSVLYDII